MIELSEVDRSIYHTEELAQGQYGELLVNAFYLDKGYEVFTNINTKGKADTVVLKDNEFETLQIKACVRFVTKHKIGLHVGPTQKSWKTIQACDHLICVIRHPYNYYDGDYGGKIIRVINHRQYSPTGNTLWFPTNDKTVEVIGEISREELAILSSFETSKYQK